MTTDVTEMPFRKAAPIFFNQCSHSLQRQARDVRKQKQMRDIEVSVGNRISATFESATYTCNAAIEYKDEKWETQCDCPCPYDVCKHAAALLLTFIEAPQEIPFGNPTMPKAARPNLAAVTAKALTREQRAFLESVRALYRGSARDNGRVKVWDLINLGLKWPGFGWDTIQVCPRPAKNEHEFLNFLAYTASQKQVPVPSFVEALINKEAVAEAFAEIERVTRINQWKDLLRQASNAPAQVEQIEVRVVLEPEEASLQWRSSTAMPFKQLKRTDAYRLQRQVYDEARLSPEAHEIWSIFSRESMYDCEPTIQNNSARAKKILPALLSRRSLRPLIVNAAGQAFDWPDETLRWRVVAPEQKNGDYQIELKTAEGVAPPPCELFIPGPCSYYVTASAVYQIGHIPIGLDSGHAGWAIPKPAIESADGLRFLATLNADLPPHLQERIQRVTLRLAFICEIRRKDQWDDNEALIVTVIGEDHDGKRRKVLHEHGWEAVGRAENGSHTKDGTLYIYDESLLQQALGLLSHLQSKWNYFHTAWQSRITKKFPELFVPWIEGLPDHVEVHLDEKLATLVSGPVSASIELDCRAAGIDWFDLEVALKVSDLELTPAELKFLLNARGKFVRLGDKGWRRLEYNLTEEQDTKLAKLGLTTDDFSSEPQRLHALQLADDAASDFLPAAQVEQIRNRAGEIKMRVTPDIPATIRGELRTYQLEGFHFLSYLATNRFGGILADDMGLGKTLQTLTWLTWLRQQPTGRDNPVLVVCPKSVVDNWLSEGRRFAPELKVCIWRGNAADVPKAARETDLFVINYAQLRSMDQTLAQLQWQAAILDEGQYIKNPDSQTAQAARSLKADHRLILSGTPIENRLLDLWSLMSFAMPGILGNRSAFVRNFGDLQDKFARSRLAARVRPFLLRRTKGQVATELPDRIEEDMFCEMEGDQRDLYRAELNHAQKMLLQVKTAQEFNESRFNFLTSLLRLRQICCHPGLVNDKLKKSDSAKLEALLDLLEPLMEEGNKVLVFSQFVTMLDLLRKAVKERKWQHFYLAGETENRGKLVENFQQASGSAVFLISLKAGGFGLNLTAASYVVLFDPWWNPAVENQAIDRTHRIGQSSKVIAYRLLIKDSIEGKIRALQKQKSALVKDILGEAGFASSLTLDDLHYLFSDDLK